MGGGMACDNLLGIVDVVSDLMRRWDIMLPEGETTIFEFAADAEDGLDLVDGLSGKPRRRSSGVGGVTVVSGVCKVAFVGVLGVVLILGTSFTSE